MDGIMRFGKHKGERFDKVPSSYMLWVKNNCSPDRELSSYIDENIERLTIESEIEHSEWMREACDGEVCCPH